MLSLVERRPDWAGAIIRLLKLLCTICCPAGFHFGRVWLGFSGKYTFLNIYGDCVVYPHIWHIWLRQKTQKCHRSEDKSIKKVWNNVKMYVAYLHAYGMYITKPCMATVCINILSCHFFNAQLILTGFSIPSVSLLTHTYALRRAYVVSLSCVHVCMRLFVCGWVA
jgi:hypothetical protein